MFTMLPPDGFGSANIDGTTYKANTDGTVTVHTPQHRDTLLRAPHNFKDATEYDQDGQPTNIAVAVLGDAVPLFDIYKQCPRLIVALEVCGVVFNDTARVEDYLHAIEQAISLGLISVPPAQPAQIAAPVNDGEKDNGNTESAGKKLTPTQTVKTELDKLGVGYASNLSYGVLKDLLNDALAAQNLPPFEG